MSLSGKKIPLAVVLLLVLAPALNLALSQPVKLPREETVYESSSWGPPAGFNPMLPSVSWGTQLMYPALFLYSPYSDEWIPYAAESYRWIDAYTLEVKIREEAKWWDGEPITAYDVEYTLKLGKKYTVPWSGIWDYLDDVKAVGPKTVRFIAKKDKLNYYQVLSVLTLAIMPKHRWEKLEEEMGSAVTKFKDDDPKKIIGGGPYRLLYVTENEWAYERVDDWWGKDVFGLPRPKYVVSRVFKDNVAAALAFEKGELDFMTHFTPKIWEMWEVKKLARRTYYARPPYYVSGGLVLLYVNWKYPLNDTNVRRAIAHALPIDEMIEKCYYNYGVKASPSMIRHMEPVYAKWIDEDLVKEYGFTYDLEKAKKILDEAGIIDKDGDGIREMPDGTKLAGFTIRVPYGWTDWMCMCKVIADNLGKIGIEVTPEFPDFSVWWDQLSRGDYDMVIGWSAGPGFDHPWNVFRFVMDPRLSHPAGNWARYNNPEVIPLIDAAAKETDPEKLKEIYSKLQYIAMRDLPAIPMFWGAVWYEYSEEYWTGWPNEENKRWFASMWGYGPLVPLFYISPKGQDLPYPKWIDELKFPTSRIFEDLRKAIEATAPATLAEKIEALNARVSLIEDEITSIKSDIGSLSSEVGKISSTVKSIEEKVRGVPSAEEIEALRAQIAALTSIAYASIGVAIIAIVIAIVAIIKKPKA